MPGSQGEELEHDLYGSFDENPHATVDLHFGEWNEGLQQALEYKIGPPIAWEYIDGTCYLWGEHLEEKWLNQLSKACHKIEREYSSDGIYDAAESASNAELKILSAEIEVPA
ncbi:hypothetical protein [Halomontanus rarus]|uniref:hypothetical protein n=1 Tax=Halomontanus rarus TaxID=3034020 RepID=UPI0023E85DC9|nr:hypothetical protein [Halovivax sp. TS33]